MTTPFLRTALVVACGLLGLAGGAQAQTAPSQDSVQLYGLIDMSVGRFQELGQERLYRAESGSMSTSYIGFSGVEDLGGGLKARFALEGFHRTDIGAQGRFNGDAFFARNAFVGLSGAFGTTQLGRNTTPLFVSTLAFNAFGDSFGFSPSIRHYFTSTPNVLVGDSGWNNSLMYSSNNYGGFSFNLLGNAGEGSTNAVGRNFSANVLYYGGPVGLTAVWQQVKNATAPLPGGFENQETAQVGGSFDFNVAKVFAQYGQRKTNSAVSANALKTRIGGLGVSVPVGGLGKILGQFGYAKTTGGTEVSLRTGTIGYDYALSKRTDVYAVYMNERRSDLSPTANSIAAGIRHRF